MKGRYLMLFMALWLSLIPNFVYSQSVVERRAIQCNYNDQVNDLVERILLRAYKHAVSAIHDGREEKKLCQCKIDEIKANLANIKHIQYGCGGDLCTYYCGRGAAKDSWLTGEALLLICSPATIIMNEVLNPEECGCLEGLMVHEIIHATTGGSEKEAVDCSKIIYPCALDPGDLETPDHRNCACANK